MRLLSSIFKYNRVIVNTEKKILSGTPDLEILPRKDLFELDRQEMDGKYSLLIKKAKQEAEKIISQASEEAKEIKVAAQAEAAKEVEIAREEGRSHGYSQGYKDGYEKGCIEGQNKGKQDYEALIKEADQIKQRYLDDYDKLYEVSEKNMVMLAIDIAKKIIGDALGKDERAYTELAYNALKLVQGQRRVQLKVSSQDLPDILKKKAYLLSRLKGIDDIEIVEDVHLDRGSCIIDTGRGIIDGSVKTQMDKIESILAELLGSSQ